MPGDESTLASIIAPNRGHDRERLSPSSCRLVLADDNEEFLQTELRLLRQQFDVVGTAENGSQAIELATQLRPQLVVLDISMPLVNGFEVASRLRELGLPIKIIFLSLFADSEFLKAAVDSGASGYVLKLYMDTELIPAIRAVMKGAIFLSHRLQMSEE